MQQITSWNFLKYNVNHNVDSISMGNYQTLEGIWSSIPCDFHESGIEELQAI